MKFAHMASAEAKFTTSTKTSVRVVPQSIVLNGYKGKHTLGSDDKYLHFLNIVYRMAKSVMAKRCYPSGHLGGKFLLSFPTLVSPILWQCGQLEINFIWVGWW